MNSGKRSFDVLSIVVNTVNCPLNFKSVALSSITSYRDRGADRRSWPMWPSLAHIKEHSYCLHCWLVLILIPSCLFTTILRDIFRIVLLSVVFEPTR